MRLLDLIVQGRCASIRSNDGCNLPGADRFKNAIRECPLRYVLSDDLVSCATQMAYAEGDRLSGCLDLIHVPAQNLWIEWSEPTRMETLCDIPSLEVTSNRSAKWAGALIRAAPNCRSGSIRTFWSTYDDLAYLSPMVTTFDLDEALRPYRADATSWRGESVLRMQEEPAIDDLLEHLRFRFDEEWASYYHERCHSQEIKHQVLRANLGNCAFDGPMLIAFALLLGARDLLPRQTVNHERLNRARRKAGKPPLLEHVEVSAPLDRPPTREFSSTREPSRFGPRLHHVRGHIVRRGSAVFWRSPHLRGSARLGQVRSRTVLLRFGPSAAQLKGTHH